MPPIERGAEAANGGFPEPPQGGSVRVVRAVHDACGGETRVRLPRVLAAGVVHRVICRVCGRDFEPSLAQEVNPVAEASSAPAGAVVIEPLAPAVAAIAVPAIAAAPAPRRLHSLSLPSVPSLSPALSLPSLPSLSLPALPDSLRDPSSPARRYATIALGALAVVAALIVIQGGGQSDDLMATTPATPLEAGAAATGSGKADGSADFVRESTFSLALPDGWKRMGAGGATFATAAPGGEADATLWVERDAKLDFPTFEARSLQQLRSLAGSAQVVERIAAPTAEATVVRLAAADAPEGSPRYEVTLRSVGPYRYYLATTLQPDASKQAADGIELLHGTFTPAGAKDSKAKGGKG